MQCCHKIVTFLAYFIQMALSFTFFMPFSNLVATLLNLWTGVTRDLDFFSNLICKKKKPSLPPPHYTNFHGYCAHQALIVNWKDTWIIIRLCHHMVEIKNEYNYSTSVKSNLLFNEKQELWDKKSFFPLLQYRFISLGHLVK